jgi:hypothetical protein
MSPRKILLFALLSCVTRCACAQTSVLGSGAWYKFAVDRPGVYRITYDLLKKAGINPGKINPQHIAIYGLNGGMLPQPNEVPRPSDLVEHAIVVSGEADGVFDKGDYILFYADGPDKVEFDVPHGIFKYENNLYDDRNYYFLTIRDDAGKRAVVSEDLPGDFPLITTFNDFAYHEQDEYNVERSGREWFGEKFGLTPSYSFNLPLSGVTSGSIVKVVSDVMAQSYTESSFKIYLNNILIGEQKVAAIPNGRYSVQGLHKRDTLVVDAGTISAAGRSSQELKYNFSKGTGFSQGFLDFSLVSVIRDLSLYGDQTIFLSAASVQNPASAFEVKGLPSEALIWDITDPYNVKVQALSRGAGTGRFSASTDVLRKWIAFNNKVPEPAFVSEIENQDLLALSTPNLLIVTCKEFESEALRLAQHRQAFSNWSVAVVTTEKIFNEFSGGRQDVTAIRDCAKYLYDKSPSTLKSILLFGKGSYDYKDRLENNTNFVPTYESRNSLHPLQTYSSDDYFAFLEESEGSWGEFPAEAHSLDVGVGRLPVSSAAQAHDVVDKIIDYDTNLKTLGAWRKKIVFVADDGNSEDNFTSLHQYQSDQLASSVETNFPAFDARRIFMGSYRKKVQPNGETVPDMADDIKRSFDQALIINFTGHGSEVVWADERILTEKSIEALTNERYPFLVTATCEFGRQDDPLQISSAERAVTKQHAGAIGLVTTARPVNATTNFSLNEAFYEALLTPTPDGYATLGEVFQKTKNNSTSGVANRNFSLIGDPSMTLALPAFTIEVTGVTTASGSDTLKALSTATAWGRVVDADGHPLDAFSGVVEATLFDKQEEFVTIGKNNPPFQYSQWNNALFRGRATVQDGAFELSFVIPKNISYQTGKGKFSFYAFDPATGADAKGVFNSSIGGSEASAKEDTTPPEISLFMGDTTFVNGGVTSPDTYLLADLTDENGINISGYGIGNSILAVLDDDAATFVLNDYFVCDVDTYRRGRIRFPVLGLAPGKHRLTVKAWDVNNNPAEARIDFTVTGGDEILVETFGNYPNPFQGNTQIFFTHNRSGDDLETQLLIYSHTGELVKTAEIRIPESEYHVNLMELNTYEGGGKKLSPGLYFMRLIVRSMTNGSKNERVTKLIVTN